MKPYLYYSGLKQLSTELSGTENIYLGIRPYGFHAGNMLPHIVYPILLCMELEKLGKVPKFNFFIFINDWEQDKLAGPDVKMYPFNIHPLHTTFQYTYDLENPTISIVDYWEPIILEKVKEIKKLYPAVSIKSVRNSQMKNDPIMKRCLLKTMEDPILIAEILRKHTTKTVLDEPIAYAMAVCPSCNMVKGHTQLKNNIVSHYCSLCGELSKGEYEDFDYWFYHKPLALPRLKICNIDVCITGSDHFNEGDYLVRQELLKAFDMKVKPPKTLYTPVVLGYDDNTMGKSKGNAVLVEVNEIVQLVLSSPNEKSIKINRQPNYTNILEQKAAITEDTVATH